MSRTISYLISDGLAPFFRQKLCQDILKSSFGYNIQYDETGNSQGCEQCDVLVQYWSKEKNELSVTFLKTLFFWLYQRSRCCKENCAHAWRNRLPVISSRLDKSVIRWTKCQQNKLDCHQQSSVRLGSPWTSVIHPLQHSCCVHCFPCRSDCIWRGLRGTSHRSFLPLTQRRLYPCAKWFWTKWWVFHPSWSMQVAYTYSRIRQNCQELGNN